MPARTPRDNPFLLFVYSRGILKLRALAKQSGVPYSTLLAVSSGHRTLTDSVRSKLAPALRCRPSSIPTPHART